MVVADPTDNGHNTGNIRKGTNLYIGQQHTHIHTIKTAITRKKLPVCSST